MGRLEGASDGFLLGVLVGEKVGSPPQSSSVTSTALISSRATESTAECSESKIFSSAETEYEKIPKNNIPRKNQNGFMANLTI